MNEPRVYKNSPFIFGLLIVIFAVLFVAIFFAAADADFSNLIVMISFALVFGFLFIFLLFTATAQTIISNNEISTKNLLGTKTLTWGEINRVSGRGNAIKLHNFNNDIALAPSPQLPGYNEVVEWIGVKRPDLFNPQEYSQMSKSWAGTIILPVIGLLFIGIGFFAYTQASDTFILFLIFAVIGLVFIGITLISPQAVTVQGDSILIGYLFNQKTLPANEIASINLGYTQTRYGKQYFIAVSLVNRKSFRITGLNPSLPIVYLTLKNWHKKNTTIGLTNP